MGAKVIIVIVLFAAAVGGAVTLALLEGGIEYRTIPELTSDNYDGERIKVKAQVLSVQNQFKPAQFTAIDIPPEGQSAPANPVVLQVIYEGDDVPGNLKKAAHVTMEGRYDAKRGAFIATMLQTQCPSKYNGKELKTADEDAKPAP
ncbi:MAG: cytochrome c maturation protein CcmE [Planctomycetes bacterium]|nr:cytochrome c maturation protein CcmE [Planctomycetota bacterium]MCA8934916.1 cytochrome c maturation protein CcmE [Planctomycetota bacterium]MCA8946225.1 cytochrome c maturation protein CcmE [Planctomycetota bacterium]